MQKLTLQLKSFNQTHLILSTKKIENILKKLNILNFQFFIYPIVRKKFTLQRSPHIDKKSREQLELIQFKGQIILHINNSLKSSIIFYIIKHSLFPGVELKFYVEFADFLIHSRQ